MNSSMFKRQKKTCWKKDKRYQNGNIEKGMKVAIDAFLYASFLVQGISRCIHYPIDFFYFCSALFFVVFFSIILFVACLFISQCLFPETIQELALHLMAELWVGSGGGGVLLEPPERRSCRKHHLLGETEDEEGRKGRGGEREKRRLKLLMKSSTLL